MRPWPVFVALLAACPADELPREDRLDRTRLLASRVDPPDPTDGATYTITSLAWAVGGSPQVLWCSAGRPDTGAPADGESSACDPDDPLVAELAALDWPSLDPGEQQQWRATAAEAGIVGLEPGFPVQATARTPAEDAPAAPLQAVVLPPTGDDRELAVLTVPVRANEVAANHHPEVVDLLVDGSESGFGALSLTAGVATELELVFADEAAESWSEDGTERVETLDTSWYTDLPTGGAVGGRPTGGGVGGLLPGGAWSITPAEAGDGVVFAVVRDGRLAAVGRPAELGGVGGHRRALRFHNDRYVPTGAALRARAGPGPDPRRCAPRRSGRR